MKKLLASLIIPALVCLPVIGGELSSAAPENANTYLIAPKAGATVDTTFTVKFGLSGMGVAPAGIEKSNTGHHHLLIDVQNLPDLAAPLPSSTNVRHFGGGQTEAEITLEPGVHSLQLILGNHLHIPHQPAVISEKVTITVE